MKSLPVILLLLAGFIPRPIQAQNIVLKNGQTLAGIGLRRAGDSIMTTVTTAAGKGEIGYPVNSIAKIAFPEPESLKAAAASIGEGKAEQALTQIEPVVVYHAPFKDISGSWWAEGALLKAQALLQLKRDQEAEKLIDELSRFTQDPQISPAAKILMGARLTRKGEHGKAMEIYDAVIKEGTRPGTLAQAWLNKGHDYLAQQQYESALLAYLRIPVLYSDQQTFLPAALGGSISAYAGLEDWDRARVTAADLIRLYPSSTPAAAAKVELQKIEKKQSPPAPTP